jgi:hypothetical protein
VARPSRMRPRVPGVRRRCPERALGSTSSGRPAASGARGGGTEGGSASQAGSLLMTFASVSATSSPPNARRPVSISNSTAPKAQMSARLSTVLPRAGSGAMYAAVPRIIPACVIAGVVMVGDCVMLGDEPAGAFIAFASPKSRTFTAPSARTLMFAGFRSRWMIACSCAASSASAICFAMGSASPIGTAPFAIRCDRSSPRRTLFSRPAALPSGSADSLERPPYSPERQSELLETCCTNRQTHFGGPRPRFGNGPCEAACQSLAGTHLCCSWSIARCSRSSECCSRSNACCSRSGGCS